MTSCALCRQEVSDALRHGPQELKRYIELGFRPAPEVLEPWRAPEDESDGPALLKWEDHVARSLGPYFICPSCFEQAQVMAAKQRQERSKAVETFEEEPTPESEAPPPPNHRWPRPYLSGALLILLSLSGFWQAYSFFTTARHFEEEQAARREQAKGPLVKADQALDRLADVFIDAKRAVGQRWLIWAVFICVPGLVLLAFLGLRHWLGAPPPPFNPPTPHPQRLLISFARALGLVSFISFSMGVLLLPSMNAFQVTSWWEADRVVALVSTSLAAAFFLLFCLWRLPNGALFVFVLGQLLLIAYMYMHFHARVLKYQDTVLLEASMGVAWGFLGAAWILQLAACLCMVPVPPMQFINWNASRTCPLCGRILREGATFCTFCKAWIR